MTDCSRIIGAMTMIASGRSASAHWRHAARHRAPLKSPPGAPAFHRPMARLARASVIVSELAIALSFLLRRAGNLFTRSAGIHAAYRLQPDRVGRVALDLAAQPVDLDVDGRSPTSNPSRQFVAGMVSPARSAKMADLLLRSVSLRTSPASSARARDLERVGAEDDLLSTWAWAAAPRAAGCC